MTPASQIEKLKREAQEAGRVQAKLKYKEKVKETGSQKEELQRQLEAQEKAIRAREVCPVCVDA